jgi:hypothetical protein
LVWIGLGLMEEGIFGMRSRDGEGAVGGSVGMMRYGARIYYVYAVKVNHFSDLFDLLQLFSDLSMLQT